MNGSLPAIDYTNLGYESLREGMLAIARKNVPEWTDFSESDLGVLMVELVAYACDITLYYQNRIAANLFPATSDEPESLVQLLRLIGYEVRPPAAASTSLRIGFAATQPVPVTIPERTAFFVPLASGEQLTFETEREIVIQANQLTPPDAANLVYFSPLPVIEGRSILNELAGVSNGTPNQAMTLAKPALAGSLVVTVNEPAGISRWETVDSLAGSTPADRHCTVRRDASGKVSVVFGDGLNGLIPSPAEVRVTYRVGGGPSGNLPAQTSFRPSMPIILQASNLDAAGGGTAAEELDRARALAPRLFRGQDRAVTEDDYASLALQVAGVGKAKAIATNWNTVLLFVAPSGRVEAPSEILRRDVLAHMESRRMASTAVKVVGPEPADIYIAANVRALPFYRNADVQRAAEEAVANYLAFDSVDFGQQVYLSKIYDVIQSLPQVASLVVTRFSRDPAGGVDTDGTISLRQSELPRPGYRDNPNTPPVPALPTYRPPIFTSVTGGVA